ncbi:MAG: exosome complex RNA-binding protein Csl4 [Candidatus Diapherotrites archaeon]
MKKDKEMVYPGSFLSTEEEFVPGKNAYGDEEGNVTSTTVGEKDLDMETREANVIQKTGEVKPLDVGSIVIARVSLVKDSSAMVEMLSAEKDGEERKILKSYASIPVSNISTEYVRNVKDMFRIGDFVKARVAKVVPWGIDLETRDKGLGVIKAYCVECRKPMELFDGNLKCPGCGASSPRKVSADYVH